MHVKCEMKCKIDVKWRENYEKKNENEKLKRWILENIKYNEN